MKVLFIRPSGPNPTNKIGEIIAQTIVRPVFIGNGQFGVHQLAAHTFEENAVIEATAEQIKSAVADGWSAYPYDRVTNFRGKLLFGMHPISAHGARNYCEN